MTPFPTSFSSDAVSVFLPLLRGQAPSDLPTALDAGWTLLGFGLAQIGTPANSSARASAPMSAYAAAAHLESALTTLQGNMHATLGALPWAQIAAAIRLKAR